MLNVPHFPAVMNFHLGVTGSARFTLTRAEGIHEVVATLEEDMRVRHILC